jgi:hypothetical protein
VILVALAGMTLLLLRQTGSEAKDLNPDIKRAIRESRSRDQNEGGRYGHL